MLRGSSIVLGVTGGIAAYKAAELVRLMVKEGAAVQVVMTANAQHFISPLTLQALSGQPVCVDLFDLGFESQIGHIEVARSAKLMVIAPATANIIGKIAAGIADDYLTTVLLATTAPVLICPAMNTKMFENPATQRNLETLKHFGYHILDPSSGSLACQEEGIGRLADLSVIMETIRRILTPPSLKGKRVLVSAGPTWEPFDPVRFITNPSSGKMGFALAAIAARRSAEVHLVSGPTSLGPPHGVHFHNVTTACEMQEVIRDLHKQMDVIVMAAAVSDFRPLKTTEQKVKKCNDQLTVTLVNTPDILADLGRSKPHHEKQILVGFAAETENLIQNAKQKLAQKNLDFIVANDLTQEGSGFCCDTNEVKIIDRDGNITEYPCAEKEVIAESIWDRIERLLADIDHDG